MPYSIKNKTHKWEEETTAGKKIDAKIESCAAKLLADPKFKPVKKGESKKQAAIKVCKATITKSEEIKRQLV